MRWFKSWFGGNIVIVKNLKERSSSIINIFNYKHIKRQKLKINDNWFKKLLDITYDDEIKSKYIPILHSISNIEEKYFSDIIDFKNYTSDILNRVNICIEYIVGFKKSLKNFDELKESENLILVKTNDKLKSINSLLYSLPNIDKNLREVQFFFNSKNYEVLDKTIEEIPFPVVNYSIDYSYNWKDFVNNMPSDLDVLRSVFNNYRQLCSELDSVNSALKNYNVSKSHKIVIGNAGSGKTHLCAHL